MFSVNVAHKKMIEQINFTNNPISVKHLDADIVQRIQADNFLEIGVGKSTK